MDSNAQPTFASPTGMGGGVPDMGAPAQPQVQMAPQQAPAPQPAPQDAEIAHSTLFGRAAKALMGGNTSYHVDQAGNTVAVQNPNTFQNFARNVLSASILGAAAGANGNPAQGIAGGIARGGAAAIGQQEQQDLLKRQQAEQEFRNQQSVEQQDRQKTMMQAQLQNMHSEMVARDRRSDIESAELHDKHNAASAALEGTLVKAGGTPASIPVDGGAKSSFTAPELANAFTKDPQILHGPEGFVRHFIDTTDSSELNFNGKQWVDASGQPINMSDRTTVKAIDVPEDAMNKKVDTSGKDINSAYGGKLVDAGKTYQMSPLEMDALNTKRLKGAREQATIDLEKHNAARADAQLGISRRELALKEAKEARESGQTSLSESSLSHLVTPTNVGEDGINHAFLTNAEQTDPRRASLIRQIGEGRATVSSFGLARKEGQALMEDVNAAYPSYDAGRAKQYEATLREFGPAGKSGKTLQAGGTGLEHLGRLYDSMGPLQTIPGLKTIGDWVQSDKSGHFATNSGNAAQEIATFYANGGAAHKDDVEGYRSAYYGPPSKAREAVVQQAKNMMDKIKEIAKSYDTNVPSTFVRPQTFLSPEAAAAYTRITGEPVDPSLIKHGNIIGQSSPQNGNHEDQAARQPSVPPPGAVQKAPGSDGNMYYVDANGKNLGRVQ